MKKIMQLAAVAAIGLSVAIPSAQGALFSDRALWESAVSGPANVAESWAAGYTPLAAGTPIALPSGAGLSFDVELYGVQVPTDWGTWSGGNTPLALWSPGGSVVGTFTAANSFFGLEMEPNVQAVFEMSLTTGATLTQFVDGNAGAAFFGWADEAVTSFTMTILPDITGGDPGGFAFGRMVEGSAPPPQGVPEGGSLALVSAVVFGGLLRFAKRGRAA